MSGLAVDVLFWLFSAGAVVSAWRVFRADSMVRAAYWLLLSFAGVAGILLLLGAEFLGLILLLMMAGEMSIMAVFMVMFMMNPAGLNPMMMVHQHRVSIGAGVLAFGGLAAVAVFGVFPDAPVLDPAGATAELGIELLGDSMLIFETAGVTLLATMIGSLALAGAHGRFGSADEGSTEPDLSPSHEPPTPGEPSAHTVEGAQTSHEHVGMEPEQGSDPENAADGHGGHDA